MPRCRAGCWIHPVFYSIAVGPGREWLSGCVHDRGGTPFEHFDDKSAKSLEDA